jgi:outer membrane protein TolC
VPPEIAIGVPADVLRRRPDIRQAERNLAAQTARIGVATADLYPKLTLLGSIGLETIRPCPWTGLATGNPQVTWPVFDGGAIRQNIKVQSALQEQALVTYRASVLTALKEVENALTAFGEEQNKRDALRMAVEAAGRAADLAEKKYSAGLVDFISVMDAQRQLLTYQNQLAESTGAVTSDLIALYKALGGGWEPLSAMTADTE